MVRAIKISPKACDNSQPGAAHQSHVCSDNECPLELITLPARPPQTPPQRGRAQPPAQGRAAGDGAGDVGVPSPSGPQRWGGAAPGAQPRCLIRTPCTCVEGTSTVPGLDTMPPGPAGAPVRLSCRQRPGSWGGLAGGPRSPQLERCQLPARTPDLSL